MNILLNMLEIVNCNPNLYMELELVHNFHTVNDNQTSNWFRKIVCSQQLTDTSVQKVRLIE